MNSIHEEKYRGCTIRLEYDDDPPESPREWNNLGTMVCWHRRYNLGDEQPKQDVAEWFRENTQLATWQAEVERRQQAIRDEYAKPDGKTHTDEELDEIGQDMDAELDRVESEMEDDPKLLRELFDRDHVRLPLYLYDHSGITISTRPFSCPWDSGQVGFIYCSLKKAEEEFPSFKIGTGWNATSDDVHYAGKTLRQAVAELLKSEVKTYDDFLTGQVVGFVAEDWDGEQIDSCWGFYPDEKGNWPEAIEQAKADIDCHIERYGETADLNEGEH